MKKIPISVTDFAVPTKKRGSITRSGAFLAMELGSQMHEKLQRKQARNKDYKKEVPLKLELRSKNFLFEVSGRADGIFYKPDVLVEEIKTTFAFDELKESMERDPLHPYRLQALFYAHILKENGYGEVKSRLLLASLRKKQDERVSLQLDDTFYEWLDARLRQLDEEERLRLALRRKRQRLARTLKFPFNSYRQHQDKLVKAVEGIVASRKRGMLQAPTGIGKTIGVMFPTLKKSLSIGNQLFYLTPKNSQFQVAKEALRKLDPQRSKALKAHILTSKKKLCMQEEVDCHPERCPYADRYYDKFEEYNLGRKILAQDIVDEEKLVSYAEEFKVCPYQLQLDTLSRADVIVGDYNYVYSTRAGLDHLFKDLSKKTRPLLVVDEAHNLYSRAIDYFSPSLDLKLIKSVWLDSKEVDRKLVGRFRRFRSKLIDLIQSYRPDQMKTEEIDVEPQVFEELLLILHGVLIDYMITSEKISEDDKLVNLYFALAEFYQVAVEFSVGVKLVYFFEGGNEGLRQVCCDPSSYLDTLHKNFHSVVGFSATLKPFDFYRNISGFGQEALVEEFDSAFPRENRKTLLIPQVNTTYRHRPRYFRSIADAIARISKVEVGNYFAFFPSYTFLQSVYEQCKDRGFRIVSQERHMRSDDIKNIENQLRQQEEPTIVFAVQGGVLSEGIDINADAIKGAFVIGPAVPMLSYQRNLQKEYYEEVYHDGFNYAYGYPAVAKSIQSAGRVIRSSDKKGLIVLLGERFLQSPYKEGIPRYWYHDVPEELVSHQILKDVNDFWEADH